MKEKIVGNRIQVGTYSVMEGRLIIAPLNPVQILRAADMITAHPMLRPIAFLLTFTLVSLPAQQSQSPPRMDKEPEDVRLPSGKMQKEEILRVDHEKSLEDAATLLKAAEDLKIELERTDRHVLSIGSLKQLDNIEKLTKRIRSRLKRY